MVLREACGADVPALIALEEQLFAGDAWTARAWWSELAARPRRDYVVAVGPDGSIGGYAGVDLRGDLADVMTVAVAPAAQGRGLGRVLLAALEDAARADGAGALMLEVRADNEAAQRLYTAGGFTGIGRRRRYYQPGDVDALVMRKELR